MSSPKLSTESRKRREKLEGHLWFCGIHRPLAVSCFYEVHNNNIKRDEVILSTALLYYDVTQDDLKWLT